MMRASSYLIHGIFFLQRGLRLISAEFCNYFFLTMRVCVMSMTIVPLWLVHFIIPSPLFSHPCVLSCPPPDLFILTKEAKIAVAATEEKKSNRSFLSFCYLFDRYSNGEWQIDNQFDKLRNLHTTYAICHVLIYWDRVVRNFSFGWEPGK